jgi:hypothetical protein
MRYILCLISQSTRILNKEIETLYSSLDRRQKVGFQFPLLWSAQGSNTTTFSIQTKTCKHF